MRRPFWPRSRGSLHGRAHRPACRKGGFDAGRSRLANVHVVHADGTLGWAGAAPYDAIIVAAGGPEVPESLKEQLRSAAGLVIPVGTDPRAQEIVRVTRVSRHEYKTRRHRRCPLCAARRQGGMGAGGAAGPPQADALRGSPRSDALASGQLPTVVRAFQFDRIGGPRPAAGADRRRENRAARRGDARHVRVLSHARAHLAGADRAQRGFDLSPSKGIGPMWRVSITTCGISNIRRASGRRSPAFRPGCGATTRCGRSSIGCERTMRAGTRQAEWRFMGSTFTASTPRSARCWNIWTRSIPNTARIARQRYGCLTPWQADPATYGHAALTGAYRTCENEVVRMLAGYLHKQTELRRA